MKKINIKRTTHLFLVVLFVLPLLGACQKEEENMSDEVRTPQDAYQMILGEWDWERTEINYRGQEDTIYETPTTENKTIRYIFRKDGTAVRIDNGNDFLDYKFEITSMEPGDFHLTLSPTDENTQVSRTFLVFYQGNLILTNRLGVSSYYIKNKKV